MRDGWTSAASRVLHNPEQLGELRGKVGLLAGASAKAERANPKRASQAIAPYLERILAAESSAERRYRTGVEAQLRADATPIPQLSEKAGRVVASLNAAADNAQVAETWRVAMADPGIGAELQRFPAAVRQRLGDGGMRALYRSVKATSRPRKRPSRRRSRTSSTRSAGSRPACRWENDSMLRSKGRPSVPARGQARDSGCDGERLSHHDRRRSGSSSVE